MASEEGETREDERKREMLRDWGRRDRGREREIEI